MPISGVVITGRPEDKPDVLRSLADIAGVEIFGDDDRGNIVAVLETDSSAGMERLIDRIGKTRSVLNVGLTYLNTEDEAVAVGRKAAKPFGFRQPAA